MIKLTGKINKDNYALFSNGDFAGYEVYLASADDFKYLPVMLGRLNITSVHQPRKVDLCSAGEYGERSYTAMRELMSLLDSLKFKGTIVIHGNYFNESAETKLDHIKILAERINRLAGEFAGRIKIAFETDVLFFNLSNGNRALLVTPEDFKLLGSYLDAPLGIVLDFEHIHISAIFRNFIEEFPQFYREVRPESDLSSERIQSLEKVWLKYLSDRSGELESYVRGFLDEFTAMKPSIVFFHINGTNPKRYWFDKKSFLPLVGEHLCLGEVDDKLNYKMVREYLPRLTATDPANLVLEIWPRGASHEEYYRQSIKSAEHLKKVLR